MEPLAPVRCSSTSCAAPRSGTSARDAAIAALCEALAALPPPRLLLALKMSARQPGHLRIPITHHVAERMLLRRQAHSICALVYSSATPFTDETFQLGGMTGQREASPRGHRGAVPPEAVAELRGVWAPEGMPHDKIRRAVQASHMICREADASLSADDLSSCSPIFLYCVIASRPPKSRVASAVSPRAGAGGHWRGSRVQLGSRGGEFGGRHERPVFFC